MSANGLAIRQVLIIFRKELFELFRERRTVMAVVVGPLVITPLLIALIGVMVSKEVKSDQVKVYRVGLVNGSTGMTNALQANAHLTLDHVTFEQAQAQVKNHTISAAIVLPDHVQATLLSGGSVPVQILDDPGDSSSTNAAGRISDYFQAASISVVTSRIRARGLPEQFANPFSIDVVAIKGGGSGSLLLISMMLPYMLIISAFSGTIYAAFDQVAGEKERGTLETLLVSPVSRMTIVLGKFLTVVCVCLCSSILSITGLAIAFGCGVPLFGGASASAIKFNATQIFAIAAALLPLAILFAGLLLTISIYACNQKEAQTILGPLFTLVILPAVMSMMINAADIKLGLAFVPVLNAALIIKLALTNRFDPAFIAVAFAASAGYAAIALIYAANLFQKESVLLKA